MTRLAAEVWLDVRLQARSRLYVIGIVLALLLGLAGRYFFPADALRVVIPAFYLLFLGGSTYAFVAAMLMLERGEGTLDAIRVTPLRIGEYIGSKVATLTAFSAVESLIILFVAGGGADVGFAVLLAGIALMGIFNTLVGIAQAARHDTVTDFLIPGALVVMTVLQLPLFHFLGTWTSPLFYLIPTRAPLVLIEAAFGPVPVWEWVYGLAYSGVAIAAAAFLARRQFIRHVVRGGR